jgi:glutamate-ammonia-ligase adenylyltransferase
VTARERDWLEGQPNAQAARLVSRRLAPWARERGVAGEFDRWLSRAADPAAAAANFEALLGRGCDPKPRLIEPLLRVCGASQVLATVLTSVPGVDADWFERALGVGAVSPAEHVAALREADDRSSLAEVAALLRRHKRRQVLRIGARDLLGLAPVVETVRELSALAEGAAEVAVKHAQLQAVREFGGFDEADALRFVVLGMGKLGGGELNFSSDVDLVYLFAGGRRESSGGERGAAAGALFATRVAEFVTRTLSEITEEGFVFRVDLRLRPEGQSGPIVNSLAAAITYYESLGQTWERAAMLKARPIAGDRELGRSFLEEIAPFIYRRFLDFDTVEEIEAMKRKVDGSRSRERLDRDVKLGPGGIREVEFIAQALQLVHGGRDQRLRSRSTLATLRALADLGLLDRGESASLSEAYLFLRDVEHKLQIVHERQTQVVPPDLEEERLLARRLGYHLTTPLGEGGAAGTEVDRFRADLARNRVTVRRSFESTFLGARSEIRREADEDVVALLETLERNPAAESQLAALGFAEPPAAVANLLRLREGPPFAPASARRKKALFALAPALLAAIRKASDPDQALAHMAELISAIGARTSFLALLEQNPETLRLLVGLFGSSQYLSNFFLRHPELLDSLVRADLAVVRKDQASLEQGLASLLAAAGDYETQLDTLRRFHHEELLRIGVNDIHGLLDASQVEEDLSLLADVCLGGALEIARKALAERHGRPPGRFAVIGMGKLGRRALSYNADLDLIFVYDGTQDAASGIGVHEYITKLAQRLMVVLQLTTREGYAYKIDTRLRPSGSHGPLVTSLEAFREYHRTSSALWERQALISARGAAGDRSLIVEVESVAESFVYGRSLTDDDVAEIARLRARMEHELARESEGRWDLKTGRGGLIDVEFVTEMLQLRHGHDHPRVRCRRTEEALDALRAEHLLDAEHHRTLLDGYRFLRRVESRLRIERDQAVHALDPGDPKLAALARRLGYGAPAAAARLLQDLASTRNKVRGVYDEYFAAAR